MRGRTILPASSGGKGRSILSRVPGYFLDSIMTGATGKRGTRGFLRKNGYYRRQKQGCWQRGQRLNPALTRAPGGCGIWIRVFLLLFAHILLNNGIFLYSSRKKGLCPCALV